MWCYELLKMVMFRMFLMQFVVCCFNVCFDLGPWICFFLFFFFWGGGGG